MNATQPRLDTESVAFVRINAQWQPIVTPNQAPERWFATAHTVEEVQTLIRADLAPQIKGGLPVLIITRRLRPATARKS